MEIMQQAREESEKNDPESYHWQNQVNNILQALVEEMGGEEFEAFAEVLFPGESINEWTWKQIYEAYVSKLEQVQDAKFDGRDTNDDPRHYKTNGVGHD